MGIFSKIFNQSEEESIPFDAYKREVKGDTAGSSGEDPTAGCNGCQNKKDGFCKGKSFRCEAYSPIINEQEDEL